MIFILAVNTSLYFFSYIISFENSRELRQHFGSLLDVNEEKSKIFLNEFFKRWKPPASTSENAQAYKKIELDSSTVKKKKKQVIYYFIYIVQ